MSNIVLSRNVGAVVHVANSVAPQSAAAGTINGASIDRQAHQMPLSCILHQSAGAVSGAPTTTSVQSTLQHAPDNATWVNYEPDGVTVQQTPPLTAGSTDNGVSVDLTNANRYLRVQTAVSFTGGTSPTVLVNASLVLAGEQLAPAV